MEKCINCGSDYAVSADYPFCCEACAREHLVFAPPIIIDDPCLGNSCLNCNQDISMDARYCETCVRKMALAKSIYRVEMPRDSHGRFLPWIATLNGNDVMAVAKTLEDLKKDPVVEELRFYGNIIVALDLTDTKHGVQGGRIIGKFPC